MSIRSQLTLTVSRVFRNLLSASIFCLALCCLTFSSGCVFVNITEPLDIDMNNTKVASKSGRSSWTSILGVVAWGDAGIHRAAREGDLSVIYAADQQTFSILSWVYIKHTTVVHGE